MDATPTLVMTFDNLDEAESALDWIGLDFGETDGAFEGVLTGEDGDLLDRVLADADTPPPVLELAEALRRLLDTAEPDAHPAWRVGYIA